MCISISQFQTPEFEEWEWQLTKSIGHHSSRLLTPEITFSASFEVVHTTNLDLIILEGNSSVKLHRHQPTDRLLLWIPECGWVDERINGNQLVAESGTAMLCLPGDELQGVTTSYLKGLSIIIPFSLLDDPAGWQGFSERHLADRSEALSVTDTARELLVAIRADPTQLQSLIVALADQLIFWRNAVSEQGTASMTGFVERHQMITKAREWIEAHLHESFRVSELAAALHVSARTLQYCFNEQLGHSPLSEARRMRFKRLKLELQSSDPMYRSQQAVFHQCGLAYTPVNRDQYFQWCGETPSQTQARCKKNTNG